MTALPQLHGQDGAAGRNHTRVGVGSRARRPRRIDLYLQLLAGPFLAAFDAGLYEAP